MSAAELFFKGLIVVGSIAMCVLSSLRYCREVSAYMTANRPTA